MITDMKQTGLTPEEQIRRFVLAVEGLAAAAQCRISAVCRQIGINPNTVSQRKTGERGKRGIGLRDYQALERAGVNVDALFSDRSVTDIRRYLPAKPIAITKPVRGGNYEFLAEEIASLRQECAELKRLLTALYSQTGRESRHNDDNDPPSGIREKRQLQPVVRRR